MLKKLALVKPVYFYNWTTPTCKAAYQKDLPKTFLFQEIFCVQSAQYYCIIKKIFDEKLFLKAMFDAFYLLYNDILK